MKREEDPWKEGTAHVPWQWRSGLMVELGKLTTGRRSRSNGFEKAMTNAFGAELRERRHLTHDPNFWTTIFKRNVCVGRPAPYKDWNKHFKHYDGFVTATKPLTECEADAVFYPPDRDEAWTIETQFELNYEAVGQALSYWHIFRQPQAREKAGLGKREILPKIVCFAAPEDFLALCHEIQPKVQVFYCEEANATPKSYWPNPRKMLSTEPESPASASGDSVRRV